MNDRQAPRIALLIPCRDEELTIGKVIDDFRRELPELQVYVFDNDSTDRSAEIAAERGAVVLREPRPGKGRVIDAMFDRVRADVYVMVDGDDTYPADKVRDLLAPVLEERADMAIGARMGDYAEGAFRRLHVFGNRLVCWLVNRVGGARLTDILSGYRAFTDRVVRRLPVLSAGFEVEADMTIQALYYRMQLVEVPVPYRPRPPGSVSKLNTFADGFRMLWKIFSLFRAFKPLTFFGSIGLLLLVLGVLAGIPPIWDYLTEPGHYVRHVPLAILATGLVILSGVSFVLGILLHTLNWRFLELHNVLTRRRWDRRE